MATHRHADGSVTWLTFESASRKPNGCIEYTHVGGGWQEQIERLQPGVEYRIYATAIPVHKESS